MAKQNLTELSDSDLLELLDETKDELLNLRFQIVTGQLDNNQRIGHCLLYTSPSPRDS